jgi:glycosyltransferase involved in cell wall biosynthesis
MKSLTIAIPTFNRPEELKDTLRALFSQPESEQCHVLVVDNCSSEPIAGFLSRSAPDIAERVTVHRNVANLGLSGNLMRCMELAESEWLWILADDDELARDAVASALDACAVSDGRDFTLFAQYEGEVGGVLTNSTLEFFQAINSWARLGFVSTSVYRTSKLKEILSIGTNYTYSLFPFVAMMVYGMDHCGWKAAIDSRVLVHPAHKAANTWALIASVNGYTVAELAKDPQVAERIMTLASGWCLGPIGLTHDFALRQTRNDQSFSRLSYEHKLFLISSASSGLRIQVCICRLLSHLPAPATLRIIGLIRRILGRDQQRKRGGEAVFGQI